VWFVDVNEGVSREPDRLAANPWHIGFGDLLSARQQRYPTSQLLFARKSPTRKEFSGLRAQGVGPFSFSANQQRRLRAASTAVMQAPR
jgi:hypothetical protein